MAYRKDYLHRDRRPPPPYSKHKQSDNGPETSSAAPRGASDSKLPTELFQDMCRKIANLTKVVCNLTNKLEDQDFSIKEMKQDHQKELQRLESESKEAISGYKTKIDTLEACLLEEKRQKDQRDEEFQILRRICNFTEAFRPFKNSLKTSSREQSPSSKDTNSEDIDLYNMKRNSERRPVSAYLSIESKKSLTVPNGFTDSSFITHKYKDSEIRQEEIKILLDICEKLKEEKRELQSKYDSEVNRNNTGTKEAQLCDLKSAVSSQTTAINELKTKLEKQELQYRKRIGELLQHLSQSENRAEKHVKQIKQLEPLVAAKEKQVTAVKCELSRTVELLKQSKEVNNRIQEINLQQSEKIIEQSDEIKNLKDQSSLCTTHLLESNVTIKKLQNKINQIENIPSQPATVAIEDKNDDDCESKIASFNNDQSLEEGGNEIDKENSNTSSNDKEVIDTFECFQKRETELTEEIEKTEQRYEKQIEEERLVHSEIQDNLEQQIDLLHLNFRQVLSTESEELDALRNSLEEKSLLLLKAHKELAQVTSFSACLESKLRQRDEEFSKATENLKHTQKLNLVEKLQGAMAKCLPNKEAFISSLEAKHLINKMQRNPDGKDDNSEQEKDLSTKAEYLEKRIQVLESTNLNLLKNQNTMKQAHQMELNTQAEVHKKDLSKIIQSIQTICKEEKEMIKRQYDNQLVSMKEERGHFQRKFDGNKFDGSKFDGNKFDGHKNNIDLLQRRLQEMQERVNRKEEDMKAKQIHTSYLVGLVEKLKQEKNSLLLSQVEKLHTVKHQASQQIKNLENYWQERLKKELRETSQTFEKEKKKLTSQYAKDQRLLKDKISLLQSTIFSTSVKSDKEKPLQCFEFKKLHDAIGSKDSQIRKLQEEKESLRTELAARRGRSSSLHSTHMLVKSTEMTLCLKKPRLERPPLTPQLVRRHSLVSHSEDKWFRARSQSPLNGKFLEKIPVKPSLPETTNHRASWTGDSINDLLSCAMEVSNEVEKMADEDISVQNESGYIQQKDSVKYQSTISRCSVPEVHPENSLSEDQTSTPVVYACDTIVECDEVHTAIEEKCILPNEKLVNITKKLLK